MSRLPPQTPPSQWHVRHASANPPYIASPARHSPVTEPRSQMTSGPMYSPSQNSPSYPPYQYGGPSTETPPGWVPNYLPEGQYQQNWYMQEQAPRSTSNGFHESRHPLQQGYTPANPVFQPSLQGTPFPPTYTSPQNGGTIFDNPMAIPSTGAKTERLGAAPKKRRKTMTAEPEGGSSGSVRMSPPGDGDKEKRMKTGRACDACVRFPQKLR